MLPAGLQTSSATLHDQDMKTPNWTAARCTACGRQCLHWVSRGEAQPRGKDLTWPLTLDADANVLQASLFQQCLGHFPVLDVFEEAVQLGAVDNWGGGGGAQSKQKRGEIKPGNKHLSAV